MEFAFMDLLNSDWHDWKFPGRGGDDLENPEWILKFLSKWDLFIEGALCADLYPALKGLREFIRSLIEKRDKIGILEDRDVEQINAVLKGTEYYHRLIVDKFDTLNLHESKKIDSDSPSIQYKYYIKKEQTKRDTNWILAEILLSYVKILTDGNPERIKICANPDCKWYFYDESRGMTRNWCDSKICGNLIKVRRFREKSKKEGQS